MLSRNKREGYYLGVMTIYATIMNEEGSTKKWEKRKLWWKQHQRGVFHKSLRGKK